MQSDDILKKLNKLASKGFSGNLLHRYAPYEVKHDQAFHMDLAATTEHSNDDQKQIIILRGGLAQQMAEDEGLFNFVMYSFLYEALKKFKMTNELTDVEIRATIDNKKKFFEYNKNRDTYNMILKLTGLAGETLFELP